MVHLFLPLLPVLAVLAAFAAGYAFATVRARYGIAPALHRPEEAPSLHDLGPDVAAAESTRLRFEPGADPASSEWATAMADAGTRLRGAGVKLVVFAHGSFVGDDPLAIARALEEAPLLADLSRAVRGFTRAQVSRVLGDLSNYTRDYVEAFARATGVDAIEFAWSGENHHAARVQGAARLARTIALHGGGALRPGDGVLLVGHSHGGQLFALLSQLAARVSGHEELLRRAPRAHRPRGLRRRLRQAPELPRHGARPRGVHPPQRDALPRAPRHGTLLPTS